jgi:HK97 family phage major capsid protein
MHLIDNENLAITEMLALGGMFGEYGGDDLALKILKKKGSMRDFMKEISARARSESVESGSNRMLGLTAVDDSRGYSLCSAIRAEYNRDWDRAGLEKNLSDLVTTKTGMAPNGFYAPLGVMARDMTAGTANSAGNLIAAGIDTTHGIDPLRKIAAIGYMGATFLTGLRSTLGLPRFISSAVAAFHGENVIADAIEETTALLTLTPKRIPVKLVVSRQAVMQATGALDAIISRHLMKSIMEQLEYGALNGAGAGDDPVGLRSTSGITTVVGGTNGAQISWAQLAAMEYGPATGNAPDTDYAGFIVNPASRKFMRTTPRGTNLNFIYEGGDRPLMGYRSRVSNMLPSNLTKGTSTTVCSALTYSSDWSELIVGIYGGGIDVVVDRVTMADTGQIRIVASVLAGVGLNLPAAFSKMDDALTV